MHFQLDVYAGTTRVHEPRRSVGYDMNVRSRVARQSSQSDDKVGRASLPMLSASQPHSFLDQSSCLAPYPPSLLSEQPGVRWHSGR